MEFQVSVGPTHPNPYFILLTDLQAFLILTIRYKDTWDFVPGKILSFIQQICIEYPLCAGTLLDTRDTEVTRMYFKYLQYAEFLFLPLIHFIPIAALCQFVNKKTKTQRGEVTFPDLQVSKLGYRFDSIA